MAIQSGATYALINQMTGLVLDLSAGDNKTVMIFEFHGNPNQRWTAKQDGQYWSLQSVATGAFLDIDGVSTAGTLIVGTKNPTLWDIQPDVMDSEVHRVTFPTTTLNFDLDHIEDATSGTKVILNPVLAENHQCWRFEQYGDDGSL